jgi:uncharacterized membrane protein YozB (DUF420 family)
LASGLAVFGLMPGLARLAVALAGDPEATGDYDFASAFVVVAHVVGGTLYAVLGAFQFPTALRRQRRNWHRRMGRVLVPLGLCAALSGLWLTLFYPRLHHSGALLAAIRLTFGSAMVASLVIAFVAIRRRDVLRHRKWMIRAYALGLGVATQIFTLGFGEPVFGTGELSTALLIALGWVINLAVAEWAIRRRFRQPPARGAGLVPAQKQRQPASPAMTGATLDQER